MKVIHKKSSELNDRLQSQMTALDGLYREWNARINVISCKDMEQLYIHHVLHSLAIAKLLTLKDGARILDLGTGGGFPGIPLAILFPEVEFVLIDGTQKKLRVVEAIASELGLSNVQPLAQRAEEHKGKYEFVVSRAVAPLTELYQWARPLIAREPQRHALPNGLVALKGGDIQKETRALPRKVATEIAAIRDWFSDPWYEEKYVVWVQV
jgi:16S rRNA (guanine527-N7)-methyltransferase